MKQKHWNKVKGRQVRGSQQSVVPRCPAGYRHAIDEFVDWYCSEPGLAFNKTVVVRYRMHLEHLDIAPEDLRKIAAGNANRLLRLTD